MTQRNGNTYNFKVVLLGEGGFIYICCLLGLSINFYKNYFVGAVGKTSLVLRYVEDTFNPNHITTLQVGTFQRVFDLKRSRSNVYL